MEKGKPENQRIKGVPLERLTAAQNPAGVSGKNSGSSLHLFWIALALFLCGSQMRAQEATITNLYDTGVDSQGQPLTNATASDPHYTLTSVPAGSTNSILALTTRGSWLSGNGFSDWIGPHNPGISGYSDTDDYGPAGDYTYETTFTVEGFNPGKASITGRFATDNELLTIYLNGNSLGISNSDSGINPYHSWHNFTIPPSADFRNGQNTLDFVVHNDGGPTGLRVEMTDTPKLAVILSQNELVLTWPATTAGFALQTATNLVSPVVWSNVTTAPTLINGQNAVTNPMSGSQQFFRLIR